ncbi:MAG: hypothetical protein LKG79_04590 [Furfurilactobacillus sp.]|jgi:hypothetical protein|uniref:DUF1453 domain-containing protein n=1 Tax=Furfurilactobacillus milii TaxID=2888272 RepID=A0ABT6DAA7_9LACO|nr:MULTISPECIES: hypothetical protein [Furfurilactobacillus]QLE67700.1 hypothetical protein LROSL2_2383 [Furfurilactobacillus rossiae]MCF6160448.1 hypothetical protein [Furfurilactobacillus milii]MCF6162680.1 hypothetical protein [Furfurilactobacillus milii]MCF6418311.1 hypothetical protein [Furfurilactobacillus milii]MCH4011829.1 hypothetical protein [Furfurilactobacillus sp.]
MQNIDFTNIVLALLVLYAVLKRQLSPHRIQLNLTLYLFLILFGAASAADAITHNHLIVTAGTGLFVLGSLISAVLFGYLRTLSYRLWIDKTGTVMRQGNWETIVLWIVGLFIHSLAGLAWHGSNATILLYLGITLLVQRGLVWVRAKRQYPEAMANTVALHENRHAEREQRRQRRREDRIARHNNN